jgi:hypothetical protein
MNSLVNCPSCGRTCKIPASAAGKKVKCPHCTTPFAVPFADTDPSPPPRPAPGKRVGTGLLLAGACLAILALVTAAAGGGLLVWLLTTRPPASAEKTNDAANLVPDGPTAEEVKAEQDLQAARRLSRKNLKDLAFAFHHYNDTFMQCPPAMLIGPPRNPPPGGQPRPHALLSWRVLILPFLDEDKLYREFHLDEPWDSEHNRKLIARMPKVYAPVRGETPEPGMTYYQVFVGKNTPFLPAEMLPPPFGQGPAVLPKGGPRIPVSIPDGTSNTLLVVEAGEPVLWTKPADLEYDDNRPVPKLGGLFADGFHGAAFSAEVYFLPRDLNSKDLRRLIVPNDGEIVEIPLKPLSDKEEAPAADANPNETGDVRGNVMYKGLPLTAGVIRFVGARVHAAVISPDGSYEVRDVPVGAYKVAIEVAPRVAIDRKPGRPGIHAMPEPRAEQMLIPQKYGNADTSGLQCRVSKGQNSFDIRLD